ncbi:group II intron maturase-specific domain-containing protein [Streptomyces sp. CA-106131]|uniref:group II intron maturase-specific domain-containing protein n=1 Tax=Streptomyces sp. CA-106131 TaxID=3240045 RepID=UPI003D8C512C
MRAQRRRLRPDRLILPLPGRGDPGVDRRARHDAALLPGRPAARGPAAEVPRWRRPPRGPRPPGGRRRTRSRPSPRSSPYSPGCRLGPPGRALAAGTETTGHEPTVPPAISTAPAPPRPLHPPVTQRDLEAEVAHCVGGVLSPLLANIALSVLDEHVMGPWKPGGTMSSSSRRITRVAKHLPNWRIVRYADDFVVLVRGERHHVETLRTEIGEVLAPLGLRLSQSKTRVVHMAEGFDFLGFHVKWMHKRGTDKCYVYTFIADKPVRELKRKIRALTHRRSQVPFAAVLSRINQILCGWANYFKHAVAKHTFNALRSFVWWRVVNMITYRRRMTWTALRRQFKGPQGWRQIALDGVELFNIAAVAVTRYRWRGLSIPTPWAA